MGDKGLWSLPIDSLRQLQHVVVLKDTATVGQVLKVSFEPEILFSESKENVAGNVVSDGSVTGVTPCCCTCTLPEIKRSSTG